MIQLKRIAHIWFFWLATVISALPAPGQSVTAPVPVKKPNIIFILADDLGYGDLGCYGQTKIKTPNLDQLAAQGIRFTSFYAGSTVCAPSRCSLMTGLHSGHATIRGNSSQSLTAQDLTVAELLKQDGYTTGLIGKWGLGKEGSPGTPAKKGFDQFFGYLDQVHAHDYYTPRLWRSDTKAPYDGWVEFVENQDGKKVLYAPDLFTKSALNFININKPTQFNNFKPFFLYLAYTIPHANNEEGQRSGNGMQVPTDEPYSTESWPQTEKNKAAMITRMDADIGKLIARLKELGLEENTVVFFSSDNGPHKEGGVDPQFFRSSGPWTGLKRDLFEGGIRVPLIVRWPGRITRGQVSDVPAAFWDFLPTAAEIAGTKPPEKIDGVSLLPLLTGKPVTSLHPFLYWEFHERGFQQALRMGDWKAIRPQADAPLQLYNLKNDPAEKQDVAKTHPEVITTLESYFKAARTPSDAWPIRKPPKK